MRQSTSLILWANSANASKQASAPDHQATLVRSRAGIYHCC